jgi:predicted  nucleic acid-binding Zn-ribbon protein
MSRASVLLRLQQIDDRVAAMQSEIASVEASLQARISELDRRLYGGSVRNPTELMEMQRELEAMRGRLSTAEDEALERMEQVDSALATLRTATDSVAAREAQRANAMEPLRARHTDLVAQLETANAERDALRAGAEPGDLSLYARIASHRRPAVTGLAGEFCAGCRMPVSNEERRAVRTGTGLTQCANCDRILAP